MGIKGDICYVAFCGTHLVKEGLVAEGEVVELCPGSYDKILLREVGP